MGSKGSYSARTLHARRSGLSAGGDPCERQRLACRLLIRGWAGLVTKRRRTRMIAFILQVGRAVLRPHLFAMLPGERAHVGADAMLTLLHLPVPRDAHVGVHHPQGKRVE